MKAYKIALPLLAAATLVCTGVGVANAEEPADCGAATVALTSAQSEHDKAVKADDKAKDAKDADRDLTRAEERLATAVKKRDEALKGDDKQALAEAEALVVTRTSEVASARTKADKTDAVDLRKKANKTDADALKKTLGEAQDDVNRLCGGATTTPPAGDDPADVDCDEVGASEAQRILDADRSDPNFLDQDKDGIACEVDEVLPETDNDDGGVTVNNNVAVPSGGISTGVGPRDS